jgi:stearoyl-CoA desaturase (delta-9 desaturase)
VADTTLNEEESMFDGLLQLPWWGYVVAALALTHITIAAVTLYLHRCQTHLALELHPQSATFSGSGYG